MLTKSEKYTQLNQGLKNLLLKSDDDLSNYANFVALIKDTFPSFSWVGFYFVKAGELVLGPFQGKVACTKIQFGKGVCGTVIVSGEALIVNNVNEFPGHIVCDADSQSEIVLPLSINNKIIGVLDIDSYRLNNFDEVDLKGLSEALVILQASLD